MLKFSSRTEVNKEFKLTDLYKQMSATKEARKEGTSISKVILKNVLSPNTLYCDADKLIKEIYVFEIIVDTQMIPETFIKELDASIKLHTLFYVRYDDVEASMISYKASTEKGKYHITNWETSRDIDVPICNSVPEFYKFILSRFYKYPPFEAESVDAYVKRNSKLSKLDFQISKTESAIAFSTQSKKKFEYNARLKEYKSEREILLRSDNNG